MFFICLVFAMPLWASVHNVPCGRLLGDGGGGGGGG